MASDNEIDAFLRDVQKRAFKTAMYSIREEQAALDAVQDSMAKLCENYSNKPAAELPALFGRILQNRILDHFRKDKTQGKINVLYDDFTTEDRDGFDYASSLSESEADPDTPESKLSNSQTMKAIDEALQTLPERQRQAFILRHWDGLDTDEAAKAMGVSAGSVKTHLSRATHALAEFLKARGIKI